MDIAKPLYPPTLVVVPQIKDTDEDGSIKGSWLLPQLDIAGAITASKVAKGRVATIAMPQATLVNPCFIYDVLSIYTEIVKVGNSSLTIAINIFVDRDLAVGEQNIFIGSAIVIYVAIEKPGIKRLIRG